MFFLRFLKIFFRNKYREIKPDWDRSDVGSFILYIFFIFGVAALLMGFSWVVGYVAIEMIGMNVDGGYLSNGAALLIFGVILSVVMWFIGYLILTFIRWIKLNIKIAWREAKVNENNTNT